MSTNWDNPAEMLTRAQAASAQGDRDMAYQLYARASELAPQDAESWQGRAETATSSDEALVSYGYALALSPGTTPLASSLDTAVAERVENARPTDVALLVALGQEMAEVGLNERAQTLLKRAVELDPASTDALVWLAGISPDDQTQLHYLNRALETNPSDPRARAATLNVKLPTPAGPPAQPLGASEPAALSAPSAAPGVAEVTPVSSSNAIGGTKSSMERLRKLRENVPSTQAVPDAVVNPAPIPNHAEKAAGSNRIILLLLVIVAVLAIAGVIVLMTQRGTP